MNMAEQLSEMDGVISSLGEIQADATVPKNVRVHIQNIISTLKEDSELSTKVNKAMNNLDEIVNDVNLQPYTRTQIWNIMSMLEKL